MSLPGRALTLGAALMIGAVQLIVSACDLAAAQESARARAALEQGRLIPALETAELALRLDPWEQPAAYTRAVALKRLGRWEALAEAAAAAREWSADGYSFLLLEGEGAFAAGRFGQAAEALWLAFMHTPKPKLSAAQLWRMAMLAGKEAWGPADRRVIAAASVLSKLAATDPYLSERDRAAALEEISVLNAGNPEK